MSGESKMYLLGRRLAAQLQDDDWNNVEPFLNEAEFEVATIRALRDELKAEVERLSDQITSMMRLNRGQRGLESVHALRKRTEKAEAENADLAARVGELGEVINRALLDSESGNGWGPDVTVCGYLRAELSTPMTGAADRLRDEVWREVTALTLGPGWVTACYCFDEFGGPRHVCIPCKIRAARPSAFEVKP